MKSHKTPIVVMLLIPIFLSASAPLYAAAPEEKVRRILGEVMAIQSDPNLSESGSRTFKRGAIKKIIADNFDLDDMARQALGPHWKTLHEIQQKEFRNIFQELFQDSYTRLVLDFLGREEVRYNEEEVAEDRASVKTTIMRPGEEIEVDYSLAPVGKEWLIRDVKIDGVSIVGNYKRSFSRVIKQQSYETLIERMRLQQQSILKTS